MSEEEKKLLVKVCTKTPQALVHIKHTISARQYKYWLIALKLYSEAWENQTLELNEKGFFSISLKQVTELLGYEPMKSELRKDLTDLRCEPIVVNYLEKDGTKGIHEMGFISEFKLTSKILKIKFPSLIEDILTLKNEQLKNMFLQMNWNIFNSFAGKYEAIIYKLCKDYFGAGRTPLFSVERYREYIGLKNGEYSTTDNFTKRCIKNPIKVINENELSDITVTVHFERKGRKITGLYFTMQKKEKTPILLPEIQPSPAFRNAMINITAKQQTKYLEQYTVEEIEANIEAANCYIEKLKARQQTADIGAIYYKAFQENWGHSLEEREKAEYKARKVGQEEAEHREEEKKIQQERERNQSILAEFYELPSEEQKRRIELLLLLEKSDIFRGIFGEAYTKN